jgi:hypothetical protein
VAPREELEVGSARQRRMNAEDDLAAAGPRHGQVPLLEGTNAGLNESAHRSPA